MAGFADTLSAYGGTPRRRKSTRSTTTDKFKMQGSSFDFNKSVNFQGHSKPFRRATRFGGTSQAYPRSKTLAALIMDRLMQQKVEGWGPNPGPPPGYHPSLYVKKG